VHEDLRGRQVVGHDGREALRQRLLLGVGQRDLAVLGQVPVGEQCQLAPQQGFVIGRQHAGARGLLPVDQQVGGLLVPAKSVLRRLGVQGLHEGVWPQVGQQHEAVRGVEGQDARHVQAGLLHQGLHLHEGGAVLLVGRRVHHDAAAARRGGVDAQVAPEAGVGRGGAQAGGQQAVRCHQGGQPGVKGGVAGGVGPDHGGGRGARRAGGCGRSRVAHG